MPCKHADKMIINSQEVPCPMRNKLRMGDEYWHIDPTKHKGVRRNTWMDSCEDTNALNAGTCHLTRDNCIAHAKALFSFSEIKD